MDTVKPDAPLATVRAAFERGDYATVRTTLRDLLAGELSASDRREAEEMLGRLAPDRAAIVVTFIAVAILVFIFFR